MEFAELVEFKVDVEGEIAERAEWLLSFGDVEMSCWKTGRVHYISLLHSSQSHRPLKKHNKCLMNRYTTYRRKNHIASMSKANSKAQKEYKRNPCEKKTI